MGEEAVKEADEVEVEKEKYEKKIGGRGEKVSM